MWWLGDMFEAVVTTDMTWYDMTDWLTDW